MIHFGFIRPDTTDSNANTHQLFCRRIEKDRRNAASERIPSNCVKGGKGQMAMFVAADSAAHPSNKIILKVNF